MIDWLFRHRRTGRLTVIQFPNAALGVFLAASLLQRLVDRDGSLHDGLRAVATGGLVWWGTDELLRGVNPWRRLLGAGVLAGQFVPFLGRGCRPRRREDPSVYQDHRPGRPVSPMRG